jgi:hypothetical protein
MASRLLRSIGVAPADDGNVERQRPSFCTIIRFIPSGYNLVDHVHFAFWHVRHVSEAYFLDLDIGKSPVSVKNTSIFRALPLPHSWGACPEGIEGVSTPARFYRDSPISLAARASLPPSGGAKGGLKLRHKRLKRPIEPWGQSNKIIGINRCTTPNPQTRRGGTVSGGIKGHPFLI